MMQSNNHDRHNKKTKWPIIAIICILLAASIPLTAYGIFSFYYSKLNIQPVESGHTVSPAEPDDTDTVAGAVPEESSLPYDAENVYNILLIGTDARDAEQRSRSDTMIIVSINRETKHIIMTSIMRDIYCKIPSKGENRINSAHAYGGASLLLDTIEYNFGIHIDDYITINFYGFIDAIDAIGGVPMEVSAAEIDVMNFYIRELNFLLGAGADTDILREEDAGKLLLNGKQALAYSRIRYVGNADFERTERQRDLLTVLMGKTKSLSLPELGGLMSTVLPCITTSLTQGEILSLLFHAGEYLNYEIVSDRIPIEGSWQEARIDGMSVLEIDFAENRAHWQKQVYGDN